MKKVMLLTLSTLTLAFADAQIKASEGVKYSIDGKESTEIIAKEGSVIEYKSGDDKLSIKDSVTNKSIALRKAGDKYIAASEQNALGKLKSYFTVAKIESKGAFTRGNEYCAKINLVNDALSITPDVKFIRYYQDDKLVSEYEVLGGEIKALSQNSLKNKKGDIIRLLDKDEYDIGCLVIE